MTKKKERKTPLKQLFKREAVTLLAACVVAALFSGFSIRLGMLVAILAVGVVSFVSRKKFSVCRLGLFVIIASPYLHYMIMGTTSHDFNLGRLRLAELPLIVPLFVGPFLVAYGMPRAKGRGWGYLSGLAIWFAAGIMAMNVVNFFLR